LQPHLKTPGVKKLFVPPIFILLSLISYSQIITTIAGDYNNIGFTGDGGPAMNASISGNTGVVVDKNNNIYISSGTRVRKINATTHNITTIAGTGSAGNQGDGGPAISALIQVLGMAIDHNNNIYLCCGNGGLSSVVIRMIDAASQNIYTVAGGPTNTYQGDGDLAINTRFTNIYDISIDKVGNIFLAESNPRKIRKIDVSTGIVSTYAGTGTSGYSGDGGPALNAALNFPASITVDTSGNVYYYDAGINIIRKIDPAGVITTIAGIPNTYGYSGDGGNANSASFNVGSGHITTDQAGNLYFVDNFNNRVRKIDAITNIISTIGGNGESGYSGDGSFAIAARISITRHLFATDSGTVYFYDNSARVRRIDGTSGSIATVAGNGNFSGDGGLAVNALINTPAGPLTDAFGAIFIQDHANNRIRKIDPVTNIITTIAGNGESVFAGEGGPAVSASLKFSASSNDKQIVMDANSNIYFTDNYSRIRKIDAITNIVNTIAGTGTRGFSGDGALASGAELNATRIAIDRQGNIYIADSVRIRKIDAATNIINTIAGMGTSGNSGDGGPAIAAQLNYPSFIFVDKAGNIYLGKTSTDTKIRKIDAVTNVINTIAGTGTSGNSGDGGLATAAKINPLSVYVDDSGYVYIASSGGGGGSFIRKIDPVTKIINSIAGTGAITGNTGDGGLATNATIAPSSVWVDRSGNVYFAQGSYGNIRKITYKNPVTTKAGGNWSDPNTWTSNTVPLSTDDVILLHDVTVDIDAQCKSLANKNHSLNINPGKNLIINGN